MALVSVLRTLCVLAANVVFLRTCDGQQNITAHLGENITLPCQAPSHKHFIAVEWTRPDLNPDIVFFYMDENSYKSKWHPSFHNRVGLLETQINNSLSLVLRNVNANDSGTYECRVKEEEAVRVRRSVINSPPISTITLTVLPGDETKENGKDSNVGLIAGLAGVGVFVVFLVVVFVIVKQRGNPQPPLYEPPAAQGDETGV